MVVALEVVLPCFSLLPLEMAEEVILEDAALSEHNNKTMNANVYRVRSKGDTIYLLPTTGSKVSAYFVLGCASSHVTVDHRQHIRWGMRSCKIQVITHSWL